MRHPQVRLLACAMALSLVATPSRFHNHLERSDPVAGAVLAAPPRQVRLWFGEATEPGLSRVTLQRSDSTKIALGPLTQGRSARELAVSIAETLPGGEYRVSWRTAGRDGHAVRGTFVFRLRP